MGHETILIARLFFWALLPLTVLLPVRWSTVAYLLLIQFDLTGPAFYSADSLGWENAIKTVVVPTILLLRILPIDALSPGVAKLGRIWLIFMAYATLAVLWSPYKLSALKMLGYLYAYSVLFLVFTLGWRRGWFTARTLMFLLWSALCFAALQTYLLGNEYGIMGDFYGSPVFESRFTTFSGAQSFAAFLLSLFVLLIFTETWTAGVISAGLGATIGILLTGSRSIFLGFVWVLFLLGIFYAKKKGKSISTSSIVKRALVGTGLAAALGGLVLTLLPENRLNQMLSTAVSSNASLEDVGTFVWRLTLYQKTFDELQVRKLKTLLVGSGTSSAADLVISAGLYTYKNVDPNRALHDEFLRSLYEWGLPGLLLLLAFLAQAARLSFRLIKSTDATPGWGFVAILVPMLISLTVENFLAESAEPGGAAYLLILTCMTAATSDSVRLRRRQTHTSPVEMTVRAEEFLPAR
jgi:O-antigen ligase